MRVSQLPIRILEELPAQPVLSVDGAWNAPGLNLSHWPGNTTPAELRHPLSTGIALAFARLPEARQAELARGCTALANNHYDTDGVLALFALARPEVALEHSAFLLEAAAAGDLFRCPSERAFALDALITSLGKGRGNAAAHEALVRELVERLPAILAGGLEDLRAHWEPQLERLRLDRRALEAAARDEIVHLDLAVWTHVAPFAPGRHALFAREDARDRALVLARGPQGTQARLVIDTSSWFDYQPRPALPRPDLAALAARLDALEGTAPGAPARWRAQPADSPAPELWFGAAELEFFAEHNTALGWSRLEPAAIKRAVLDALRASFVFPGGE